MACSSSSQRLQREFSGKTNGSAVMMLNWRFDRWSNNSIDCSWGSNDLTIMHLKSVGACNGLHLNIVLYWKLSTSIVNNKMPLFGSTCAPSCRMQLPVLHFSLQESNVVRKRVLEWGIDFPTDHLAWKVCVKPCGAGYCMRMCTWMRDRFP